MQLPKLGLVLLLLLTLVGVAPGCKKRTAEVTPSEPGGKAPPAQTPPTREVKDPGPPTEKEPPRDVETPKDISYWNNQGVLRTVYFTFDSHDLSASAQATLRENATWLKAHADYQFVIQGHCDERGTIEYNLALGERRAAAVRDYLATLGIARPRMRIVSYGEEQPSTPGHEEASWSQNRRAEFLLEQ
jgi:peptidoglycan-associated lipoprotein